MNAGFLDSEDFVEETRRARDRVSEGGTDAVCLENYKTAFRDSARSLGLRKSSEDRQARVHLTDTLKTLLEEVARSPGSFGEYVRYCKEQRLAILEERCREHKSEAKARHLKERLMHQRSSLLTSEREQLKSPPRSCEDIAGFVETSFERLFRKVALDKAAFEPFLRGSPSVLDDVLDVMSCPIRE
ncbi:hypothetical protein HPB47_019003 [Ixodes persulcatus]|uniref:Uncharacterized protein n=1 Tax=Ixodes persulcatus TaxID=34615 RepID=A0AC60QK53_IXOPE|nr:hypothetical protein HPB47_019003 [Ixodes persulcatus]